MQPRAWPGSLVGAALSGRIMDMLNGFSEGEKAQSGVCSMIVCGSGNAGASIAAASSWLFPISHNNTWTEATCLYTPSTPAHPVCLFALRSQNLAVQGISVRLREDLAR